MYQLTDSIELIPSDNNTLIYLPKIKQFTGNNGHNENMLPKINLKNKIINKE